MRSSSTTAPRAGAALILWRRTTGYPVARALVEIGGSFRIPDIMAKSGARLAEVGTTNRTHLTDYERALAGGGVIVKIHRSNFALQGFVAEVSLVELAKLAAPRELPVIYDLGSGLLLSLERFGLTGEPLAGDVIRDGATVVTMSGDKLRRAAGGHPARAPLGQSSASTTRNVASLSTSSRGGPRDDVRSTAIRASIPGDSTLRMIPTTSRTACSGSLDRRAVSSRASRAKWSRRLQLGGGSFSRRALHLRPSPLRESEQSRSSPPCRGAAVSPHPDDRL